MLSRLSVFVFAVIGALGCSGEPEVVVPTSTDFGLEPTSAKGDGAFEQAAAYWSKMEVPDTLAVLGDGSNDASTLTRTVVANANDGLAYPRDMAFNPNNPGQLWIVNTASESVTIVQHVGSPYRESRDVRSEGSSHFHARPAAIAWGANNSFATIHETDEMTQGPYGSPGDFMGPTLQSADLDTFDAGHGSHIDMLHNTPLGMGIAWQSANIFWVFDGAHSSLTRYDFRKDHGKGGSDHRDGIVLRFAEGLVRRAPGIPSHMEVHQETGLLYVADTGNSRVLALDTTRGTVGDPIFPNYDGSQQYMVKGADVRMVVDGKDYGIERPSGLAIHNDVLYIGDHATNRLFGFTLHGDLIDYVQLPISEGGMMGIEFDAYGALYVADARANEVVRFRPPNHAHDYANRSYDINEYESNSRIPRYDPNGEHCNDPSHAHGDTE
ncbi:MAG: hypothetical protein VX223_12790 [Myxococcota bacterium]|nr:hypothetical protein [Myxococcota bacterium]